MKFSKQREQILETLKNNCIHPTAEQVYALVKPEMPSISLATVYRNLNQLAENGVIGKIEGLDGTARFDYCREQHYHFICTKCNKVYDVPYNIAPEVADKVREQTGLKVDSYEVSLKGICPDCLKKSNN